MLIASTQLDAFSQLEHTSVTRANTNITSTPKALLMLFLVLISLRIITILRSYINC